MMAATETTSRADEFDTDLRTTALREPTGLLDGQAYEATVEDLHLTVSSEGRPVTVRAQRYPNNGHWLWFSWAASQIRICLVDQPQDEVAAVEKRPQRIPIRKT